VLNVLTQARKKEAQVPVDKITALLLTHQNRWCGVRREHAGNAELEAGVAPWSSGNQ